jgi:hypothetical protein
VRVGLAVVPGRDGVSGAGLGVQGLEPAGRVTGRRGLGGELAGTAARKVIGYHWTRVCKRAAVGAAATMSKPVVTWASTMARSENINR